MSSEKAENKEPTTAFGKLVYELKEILITVAIFLPIWFVFSTVFYELRSIPSESMVPTLQVGDRVAVSKFAYGYSRNSLPLGVGRLLPLGKGRLFAHQPKRGDVVVFRHPFLDRVMIKRLIGLPGDRIQVINNRIYLNGEVLPQELIRRVEYRDAANHILTKSDEYLETNPEGKSYLVHDILSRPNDPSAVFEVPEGYYFFMGDNRDNSADSRVLSGHCPESSNGVIDRAGCPPRLGSGSEPTIGFVPFDNIIGRADTVIFTFNFCGRYEYGCPKGRVWKSL